MKKLISSAFFLLMFFSSFSLPTVLAVVVNEDEKVFSDVSLSHPHYEAIKYLKEHDIVGGYPDGSFQPEQVVKRAEALRMIFESGCENEEAGCDGNPVDYSVLKFSDIDMNGWYKDYLARAVKDGVVAGYDDGTFQPEKVVNLAESMKMLALRYGINDQQYAHQGKPYEDVTKESWYFIYFFYPEAVNLLDADAQGNVMPGQGMTRATLAEAIYRLRVLKETGAEKYVKGMSVSSEEETQQSTEEETQQETQEENTQEALTEVSIDNFAFSPKTVTIKVGSIVEWTNIDSAAHTVTSDDDKFMSSGNIPENGVYGVIFNDVGTYTYHCALHPSMKGTVIVEE